jgi:hypothetical protein
MAAGLPLIRSVPVSNEFFFHPEWKLIFIH